MGEVPSVDRRRGLPGSEAFQAAKRLRPLRRLSRWTPPPAAARPPPPRTPAYGGLSRGGGKLSARVVFEFVQLEQFLAAEIQVRPDGEHRGAADLLLERVELRKHLVDVVPLANGDALFVRERILLGAHHELGM